jgi:hypothetical protein
MAAVSNTSNLHFYGNFMRAMLQRSPHAFVPGSGKKNLGWSPAGKSPIRAAST